MIAQSRLLQLFLSANIERARHEGCQSSKIWGAWSSPGLVPSRRSMWRVREMLNQVEGNVPVPEVGEDQVMVRVVVAGINPVETYIREGGSAFSWAFLIFPLACRAVQQVARTPLHTRHRCCWLRSSDRKEGAQHQGSQLLMKNIWQRLSSGGGQSVCFWQQQSQQQLRLICPGLYFLSCCASTFLFCISNDLVSGSGIDRHCTLSPVCCYRCHLCFPTSSKADVCPGI